jgi:hypothetical protein
MSPILRMTSSGLDPGRSDDLTYCVELANVLGFALGSIQNAT